MAVQSRIVLEPSAQGIVDATSTPPFLYELEPAAARKVLDDLQAAPVDKLPVDEEWITVPAAVGDVRVRIVQPARRAAVAAGRRLHARRRLDPRQRRARTTGSSASSPSAPRAALLFVEYPNSPEARYPVAIEQGYATAQWVVREGAAKGLDATRMAVAGESVGGNMAAALTLMAKQRGDVTFVQTSMYYPVTDAAMDTALLRRVRRGLLPHPQGDGVVLGRLHHRPRRSARRSPPRPTRPRIEQLRGLPPTLLLVDEADPLRDEGEAYAAKLRRGRRRRSRPSATTASSTTSCCSTR